MENHPILSKINLLKITLIILPVIGFFEFIFNYFISIFTYNSQLSIFVVILIRNILFSLLYVGNYIFIGLAIIGIKQVKNLSVIPNPAKGFIILSGLQFLQMLIVISSNILLESEFLPILSLLLMCIFVGIQCFAFISLGKFVQKHLITNPQDRMGFIGVILISVHFALNFVAYLIFQIFYIFIYLPSFGWDTYTFDSNFYTLILLSNIMAVVKIFMGLVNVAGFVLLILQLSRKNIATKSGGNRFEFEHGAPQNQINNQPQFSSNISAEQIKFCKDCGNSLQINAKFCNYCGNTVD